MARGRECLVPPPACDQIVIIAGPGSFLDRGTRAVKFIK